MINLLPDQNKRNIVAARTNVILLRYNLLTVAAIALLASFYGASYVIMHTIQLDAQTKNADSVAKVTALASVKSAADAYRNNLTIARTILDKSVNYTDTIIAITKLLPNGIILDSLSLDATSFSTPMTLTAHAKDYAAATQFKQNFQSSSLFSKVYFVSLTDGGGGSDAATQAYPLNVSLNVTINKQVTN
jgi:Tfp pilus assembly protein PilN